MAVDQDLLGGRWVHLRACERPPGLRQRLAALVRRLGGRESANYVSQRGCVGCGAGCGCEWEGKQAVYSRVCVCECVCALGSRPRQLASIAVSSSSHVSTR